MPFLLCYQQPQQVPVAGVCCTSPPFRSRLCFALVAASPSSPFHHRRRFASSLFALVAASPSSPLHHRRRFALVVVSLSSPLRPRRRFTIAAVVTIVAVLLLMLARYVVPNCRGDKSGELYPASSCCLRLFRINDLSLSCRRRRCFSRCASADVSSPIVT